MKKSIFKLSEVDELRQSLHGKRVVLAGGCFDIFHYGHLKFLEAAKQEGDLLVIALESDEFIEKKKQRKPVHTQEQKAEILAALNMVDYILMLPLMKNDADYFEMVKKLKPDIVAVTEGDSYIETKQKQVEQIGGQVKVVCPMLSTFSTSNILSYASIFSG